MNGNGNNLLNNENNIIMIENNKIKMITCLLKFLVN